MTTRSYNENSGDMATVPHGYFSSNQDHTNISNDIDQTEVSDQTDQPRYLTQLARGRAANFLINGDVFFPAKKVVYNPRHFRDFTHYLDYLTDRLEPRFGAVRKICTPHHGHRIRELRDLQENGVYVVAGKEKFKPYQYDQIAGQDKKRTQPVNYHTDPLYPSRQYVTSGRIKKCEVHSILIKVWPNGGDLKGPRRVLLTPRVKPFTLPNVLSHVNEILKEDLLGTVERLHFLNGVQVSDVDQITQNGQYVACRRTERFKRVRYTEQGTKNLSTSPRLERKLLAPILYRGSNSISQSSPEQSNTSTQSSVTSNSHRRRAPRTDEQVFPAKPFHSRSSDRSQTFDPDKDHNGTFKPKQNNRYTQDPRSVQEYPSTRQSDLPVHHWGSQPLNKVEVNGGYKPRREQRVARPPQQRIPQQNKLFSTGNRLEDEDNAATKIQAAFWGHQTRKELISPKQPKVPKQMWQYPSGNRLEEEDNAATKIQAAYRAHQTRQELKSSKQPTSKLPQQNKQDSPGSRLDHEDSAAAKIQAAYRGHQTRKELKSQKLPEVPKQRRLFASGDRLEKEDNAAAKIQAAYRGHQTRKSNEIQFKKSRDVNTQHLAAAKIQAGYRGYQQRKSTTSKAPVKDDEAARKIQAGYRGYQTRKQLALQQKMLEEEKAASKIQAGFRGYQTRNHITEKKVAATKIQSSYRGYLTRKTVNSPQKVRSHDEDAMRGEQDKAAAKIQAGYRGYMSRKQISSRQPPPAREDSYDGLARENKAAVTIQSHYRGYLTRQQLAGHQSAVN